MWAIKVASVADEVELDQFIKTRYGPGCKANTMSPSTTQEGVFDVGVHGDGMPMDESQCPINYWTVVKYAPDAQKVVAWNVVGQAYTFVADQEYTVIYDEVMIDSFRFIE